MFKVNYNLREYIKSNRDGATRLCFTSQNLKLWSNLTAKEKDWLNAKCRHGSPVNFTLISQKAKANICSKISNLFHSLFMFRSFIHVFVLLHICMYRRWVNTVRFDKLQRLKSISHLAGNSLCHICLYT
jgi:hypothetical protein